MIKKFVEFILSKLPPRSYDFCHAYLYQRFFFGKKVLLETEFRYLMNDGSFFNKIKAMELDNFIELSYEDYKNCIEFYQKRKI